MTSFHFKNQENLSLRQRVMSDIRNAIIQGHLKPGDKLRELDISQQMAISRGPIREALRDLEALGLVVSSPYRETTVADVSKGEVVDLLIPIRLQLEIHALKQKHSNWSETMYQSLRDIIDIMKSAADNGDLASLVEADIRFHEIVVSSEDSAYTQQIWSGIVNRLRLHFIKNTKLFTDLARVPAEHEELLIALQNEPFDRIEKLWTQHILQDDCLLCFHDDK
ncbi:GntR family transcriptional regulator [Cohnella silvisoli]|uniref:GntR family transcriptional regulator n=1 Tax=Cohnella silvisoli TaxID=2873699 RepID=A0ABV1KX41_9BACL|nr:GntR family transcriptional regulator [Cohnella silvisoli]MCD9023788.1 GntR family transcriptional regulator [Cohnella silvisoli]